MLVLSFNLKGGMPVSPSRYGRPWSEAMTTIFWKISAKCTNFQVSGLGSRCRTSSLEFRSRSFWWSLGLVSKF